MWEYRARPVTVVDGDTIDVDVDLGFQITREVRLRLLDVDTHEIYGVSMDDDEYERGKAEQEFTRGWLAKAEDAGPWPLIIQTEKTGKYGRYLADVRRVTDGATLNEDLVDEFGDALRM